MSELALKVAKAAVCAAASHVAGKAFESVAKKLVKTVK